MSKIKYINNPKKSFEEIEKINSLIYNGFMALAMDYSYHINNFFGLTDGGKHEIFELRENIIYRNKSAKLHFYLLLKQKLQIEDRFEKMLKENPTVFNGFIGGNPHFESASQEIMALFDSIIFHLSSSFDYLAMLTQFIFGNNPQTKLDWITLVKHCHNKESNYSNRKFAENIKSVNADFVSKFNDYRAELIHRRKSESFASVTWEINSGNVITQFRCSDKIKSHLKKVADKNDDYCITYASFILIKQTLLKIGNVLEGMHDEFRENYNEHSPALREGAFQIVNINSDTNYAESPALGFWKSFMEYKSFC